MSIIVYINIGKVVEALKKVGISARVPTSEKELSELFVPFTYQETLPDGSVVHIQGGPLNDSAAKVAFEFMSLGGFVECVSQSIKALVEIAKTKGDAEMTG